MPSYRLTKDAETDLLSIWRYTRGKWSETQADLYLDELDAFCDKISSDEIVTARALADIHANLYYSHHNHHYVFWLSVAGSKPIVVAFLHDRMDFVRHLSKRLKSSVD